MANDQTDKPTTTRADEDVKLDQKQKMGDTANENISRQQETKVSNQRTSSGETSTAKDQTQNREMEVERSKDRVPDMPN